VPTRRDSDLPPADALAGRAVLDVIGVLVAWMRHEVEATAAIRRIADVAAAAVAELDRHAERFGRREPP
jgi:hypothetical protein